MDQSMREMLEEKDHKIALVTIVLYGIFLILGAFLPLFLYDILILVLTFEYTILINRHFQQLDRLVDIDYLTTFSQRRILTYNLFNNIIFTVFAVLIITLFRYTVDDFLGFEIDFYNCYNPVVQLYYLFRISLMFWVIERIHAFVIIRHLWGVEYKWSFLTKYVIRFLAKVRGFKTYDV